MSRRLGPALTCAVLAVALPALAQAPMSPIFPTLPSKSAQPPVSRAPLVTNTPPAVTRTAPEDPVVATAPIPPPLPNPPAENAATQKSTPLQRKAESSAPPQPSVKRQKRIVRRSHYARRYYAPFYGYPNYGYATAVVSGWGGGRFGPSPYSSTGQ